MTRIAIHIGDSLPPNLVRLLSGIEKIAEDTFELVIVGTGVDSDSIPSGYEYYNVPNVSANRGVTELMATYRRLNIYIKETSSKPDALWQLTTPQFHAVPTLLVGKKWNIPVATRIPGNKFDEYREQTDIVRSAKTFIMNNLLLRLVRFSKLVVVLSEYNRTQTLARGVPDAKIRLLRQPINTDTFTAVDAEQQRELKSSLGFDRDAHIVLYVGRLSKLKGMKTLGTIAKKLETENYEFHLAGAGPYQSIFETYGNVVCHGFVDPTDLHRYYKIADVYVHPSHTEEQGISWTMIEAAATGLPVLARDVENASKIATAVFTETDDALAWLRNSGDWEPATYPTEWSLTSLAPKYNEFFTEITDSEF